MPMGATWGNNTQKCRAGNRPVVQRETRGGGKFTGNI